METRKLQQVGGGTYTVSIPKDWIETQGLEAGETIHLYPHVDDSLLVRASKKDDGGLASTRIETNGNGPEHVRRALSAAHAIGFDTITLVDAAGFDEEDRRAIDLATRDLVGLEIVESDEEEVTVQNLLDGTDFSVRQSVVQLQYVAATSVREAASALVEADADAVDRIEERTTEADRLFDALSRHFNRSLRSMEELDRLGISREALFDYYVTASQLEAVTDQAMEIAKLTARLDEPIPSDVGEELVGMARTAVTTIEDATTAVLEDDGDHGHEALDQLEVVSSSIDAFDDRLFDADDPESIPPIAARVATRTNVSLSRVVERGRRIAEVAIRDEARRREIPAAAQRVEHSGS